MWKVSGAWLLGESPARGEVVRERLGEAKARDGDEPGVDEALAPAAALARLRSATKAAARALASSLLSEGEVGRLPAGEASAGNGGS